MKNYAEYHVAFKLLLKKGDEYLFLKWPNFPTRLDLPGGRIDNGEEEAGFKEIITREIREELGQHVGFSIGGPLFQFRRIFPKHGLKIFLTVYDGDFKGGEIILSEEHNELLWLNPHTDPLREDQFFNREEFDAFKKYFK